MKIIQFQPDLEQSQFENLYENQNQEQLIITEESDAIPNDQSFNSQPICNQEFCNVLDNELSNKPRDLYVDTDTEGDFGAVKHV